MIQKNEPGYKPNDRIRHSRFRLIWWMYARADAGVLHIVLDLPFSQPEAGLQNSAANKVDAVFKVPAENYAAPNAKIL